MRWVRLAVAALAVAGLFLLVGYAAPPSGLAGRVIRRNLADGRDATPLFWSEAEPPTRPR